MKLKGSAQDPLWYKDAVIYETHVKAFFDSNNDGVGDFKGLIQKLDYLQDLGVTCLWLLPFFPSPLKDDGYDISDYTSIHPSYGTMEDFRQLLGAARERDLQVMIELVVNHTSDQHPWFQAARRAAPGSEERAFYVWSETAHEYRDTRVIFTDTEKSNWTWDPDVQAYYWHRFFSHQPDLNFDNPAVVREVVRAMQFWLDLGVDALRLDAIPYLVERDGTNCENLPETHAVIRHMRRELEQRYANRMLLAEANQWPSDVIAYFGQEDECHMAFHFPLMPRIFMALRLEDRHPITEIMAQTPAAPPSCQWGLFLRNHDELTLEMVMDEERDYMYLAYSTDPRMRVNVGIRRRLAPLMENNRRRIELLSGLLFSFPGTPILYYGDEIGMGDNIYLGDRNGVRTPMQWTADRNAGFSRANPAKLYSPVIMDPVYGYEAVNVEAQLSDPSSLLRWMRNMIALRKLFRVFGRGTLEFLEPENRKVLAYTRRYEDEQILCVANLSRFAQPMELDLSSMAGMIPVEMLGFTEFPPISRAPYRLTLGPYEFFWFELQGAPEPVEISAPAEVAEESPVVIGGGAEALFSGPARKTLENEILPAFLPRRRWFGGKARKIATCSIRDWMWVAREPARSALVLVDVGYQDGSSETYDVPMAVATGRHATELQQSVPDAVLCGARVAGETGVLYDALADDATCLDLLEGLKNGRSIAGQAGSAEAFPTSAFGGFAGDLAGLKVVRGSAEQSNTSILFGGELILKLFRKIERGPNPDFEIGRYLTEQAGFAAIPALLGAIEYSAPDAERSTLAMLQELVPNQGDGWTMTLDELGRYYEQCALVRPSAEEFEASRNGSILELSESDTPPAVRERVGLYIDAAARLGRRTAEMHLALAAPTEDPAFHAELLAPADLQALAQSLREHAGTVFAALRASLPGLPDDVVDRAALALAQRGRIMDRFQNLEQIGGDVVRMRIHGDYHLGQVLWVNNDFVILDFEGEPARPLAERRLKQPALKDVAGMLRSFSYAAFVGLLSFTKRRPEDYEYLEPWAAYWERWVSAAFLRSYRQTAADAAFLPASGHLKILLEAFLLDKALYELKYELNNRPAWVIIPLHGLLTLAR